MLYSGNGFKIDYTSSYSGCGGILTGYEGNVYMTPYPDSYKNDEFCTWQIVVPSDKMVQVSFNEIRIKYDSSTDKCFDDEFLAVYQGTQADPKAKLLKQVCGVTTKEPVARATTNLVTLEFRR